MLKSGEHLSLIMTKLSVGLKDHLSINQFKGHHPSVIPEAIRL